MKKSKKLLLVVLSGIMIVSCLLFTTGNSVNAAETFNKLDYIYSKSSNYYEFNPTEMLEIYAENSTGGNEQADHRYNGKGVLVRSYDANGNLADNNEALDAWSDGRIDAADVSNILALSQRLVKAEIENENYIIDEKQESFNFISNQIIYSLAKELNIPTTDIILTAKTVMDEVKKYDVKGSSYELNNKAKTVNSTIDKIKTLSSDNITIIDGVNAEFGEGTLDYQETNYKISVTVDTKNNGQYRLVLGKDNKFYLITDKKEADFSTIMKYDDTKDDGTTYKPQYKENDVDKKDLDVVVTIKSETDEDIASTNGVALTNDKKPNSEGWYYPDLEDKSVIAKVYKFDEYDNTTANGKVNETVALVGVDGGKDTQKPSIEWTFRRKSITETENADGSVTFVITYNLPVDEKSVPSDWKVIYDEDGKTVHKITKTIKKGEDYDKDVKVKQNGTDKTVTTHVKKTWAKDKSVAPKVIPQTGAFTAVLGATIAGFAVFAVTRYRKLRK